MVRKRIYSNLLSQACLTLRATFFTTRPCCLTQTSPEEMSVFLLSEGPGQVTDWMVIFKCGKKHYTPAKCNPTQAVPYAAPRRWRWFNKLTLMDWTASPKLFFGMDDSRTDNSGFKIKIGLEWNKLYKPMNNHYVELW